MEFRKCAAEREIDWPTITIWMISWIKIPVLVAGLFGCLESGLTIRFITRKTAIPYSAPEAMGYRSKTTA
jgi:hypothetical protein